jgi:hypothetical protein
MLNTLLLLVVAEADLAIKQGGEVLVGIDVLWLQKPRGGERLLNQF